MFQVTLQKLSAHWIIPLILIGPIRGQDCEVNLRFVMNDGNAWTKTIPPLYFLAKRENDTGITKQLIEPFSIEGGIYRFLVNAERSKDFLYVDISSQAVISGVAPTTVFALPGCGQYATVAMDQKTGDIDSGALLVNGRVSGWTFNRSRRYSIRVVPLFSNRSRDHLPFGEAILKPDGSFTITAPLVGSKSALMLLENGRVVGIASALLKEKARNDLGEIVFSTFR